MPQKTIKLVDDYLEGKLSARESAGLETWYLLKAENAEEKDRNIDYDLLSQDIWNKIEHKIDHDDYISLTKTRKISWSRYAKLGIAASLLLIAGLGYFFINKQNVTADRFVIAPALDLTPGKDKATLTLSDGRKVNLDQNANGKIASETGVEITKSADGMLVYKTSESKIQGSGFNTISTPVGGQYSVILPDGSKVWLNSSSSLKYPTSFAANGRKVVLTGEGYFEVAHMENKGNKIAFTVEVSRGQGAAETVEVLGTHFNINAYADEQSVKTTLLQGSVKVLSSSGKTALLKPGQQSALTDGALALSAADTEMAVAWKNGEFVFREDLRSAMRKVARWYDVEVIYSDDAPKNLMLGGWMSRATNISDVLNHIQLTGKVHFKLEGRRVTVSK